MTEAKTTATQVGRDAADKVRETVSTNALAQKAKEAAYTLVGLGVMGAQRATVATKQATTKLRSSDAKTTIDVDAIRAKSQGATKVARQQFTKADDVLGGAFAKIEEALAPFEERLPGAAKETVQKLRVTGKELHAQVRVKIAGEVEAPAKPRAKRTEADAA